LQLPRKAIKPVHELRNAAPDDPVCNVPYVNENIETLNVTW